MNWETVGWRVRVRFTRLLHQIRPKDHMDRLRGSLPQHYSPLRPNGDGLQGVYLTEVPPIMAELLIHLIGSEAFALVASAEQANGEMATQVGNPDVEMWEHHLEQEVEQNPAIDETQWSALVMARRGQGLFKDRVRSIEHRCRITAVDKFVHLRASHLKPWRDATNEERLAGENGLLLTPSIDHLLDKGFIGL